MSTEKSKKPNIYQRLHAVMQEVTYVQKEDKKVNNQYRFVSHDAVTAKVRPALMEHGVIYFPQNLTHIQNGNRTEVTLDIVFVSIDNPKDSLSVPSLGYGVDTQDKGPGKAISYAVKYALLKALGLGTGDDPEKDLIDHTPEGNGIGAPGNKRTGNKAIDSHVNDCLGQITNCANKEDTMRTGRALYKNLKDSGATEDQLQMIKAQVENHCEFLSAKGIPA